MARPVAFVLLLLVALTAGCLDPGPTPSDPLAASIPDGERAGSPSTHGGAEPDESAVSVSREGSRWVARQTITLSNDFGGASHSKFTLDTLNGDVRVGVASDGGYEVVANLHGAGDTEAQARHALDDLRYSSTDSLGGSTLTVSVRIARASSQPLPLTESNGASIAAKLPPEPGHAITADSSNGGITVTGLHGTNLVVDSSNGDLSVSGAFADVVADTSNGAIGLSGTFNTVVADTSNGAITATVRATRSGSLSFSSSNGAIRVTLEAGADRAFDAAGDTSNGQVTIDLGDAQASDEDEASARSPAYGDRPIQVEVDAETSNGGITITAK